MIYKSMGKSLVASTTEESDIPPPTTTNCPKGLGEEWSLVAPPPSRINVDGQSCADLVQMANSCSDLLVQL